MEHRYHFGEFTLDLAKMALIRHGSPIELRPKAFDTLRALVEHSGEVMTKDELVAIVWPDVTVNDDALSQCIRDVRKALGDNGHELVRTVPKRGYIFESEVEIASANQPQEKKRQGLYIAAVLILLVAAVAVWAVKPQLVEHRQITVAVLPFATVGPDAAEGWLGEGIAEDIMTELSRFTDLGIIARNSSFRFAEAVDSPQLVGERLRADYLLQGSVRRLDEKLRVALQLVETDDGRNVWAERYDEQYSEVFVLPEKLSGAIAARLAAKVRTDAAARAARKPRSLDAFEATLLARHAYHQFARDEAYEGLEAALRATRLDPDYALAWEFKARLLLQFYVQPYDDRRGDQEVLKSALEAARRAERLDPTSSSAVSALGDVYTWFGEQEIGLQHLRRAVELNPNDSSALKRLADGLGRAGLHAESLVAWEEGNRLDPIIAPLNYALMGRSYLMMDNPTRALELTGDCIELTPNMMPCHIFNAMAAEAVGEKAAATASVKRILTLAPGFTVSGWLKIIGYRDEATITRLRGLALAAGLPD